MLEDKNSVLDNPKIKREEASLEPVKKKKRWMFKLILILIVVGVVYYLFKNPEVIMEPVNKFLGRFK